MKVNDWVQLTPTHLETYLMARQIHLLRTVVLGAGESDPLPKLIADVTRRVRQAIGSNGKNRMSDDQRLIPAELQPTACALALEALQGRIPLLQLSQEQRKAADVAREQLYAIANGDFRVSPPRHPAEVGEYGNFSSMIHLHVRRRQVTASALSGL
ncbi:MAG: hypothetical protein LBI34_00065 [Puniceicoccales bacterium]|nr:hypothetical protein [Puniceicoccales bacterium]